ncbi:hypothetical protein V6N11_002011 [Hibiscus sabdariffa]|uniref:Reverse transcriptase zinc-binding domain-containing protein n=1 Tax=Hibiscus sabdariffa TaxID=183260 RepID=A0ABR2QU83_9ROSI
MLVPYAKNEHLRQHLAVSACCSLCHGADETVDHALRTCSVAASSWSRLVRPSKLLKFMSLPFDVWFMNLCNKGQFVEDIALWEFLFLTVCWQLWKRRCDIVMDDNFVDQDDLITRCRCIPRSMNKVADSLAVSMCDQPIGASLF